MRVGKPKFFIPKNLIPFAEKTFRNSKYTGSFDNLSLLMTKFCPFSEKDGELEKPKYDRFGYKIKLPENVLKLYDLYLKQIEALWSAVNAKAFELKTKSRLVIGLGDESVYETSIRLHRNYGVPYIPGSALKGVTKHYAILSLAHQLMENANEDFFKLAKKVQEALETAAKDENNEREVEKVVKEKLNVNTTSETLDEIKVLRKIFGTQKQEGSIIFFDAFPNPKCLKKRINTQEPILELDIMNPHYGDYYTASEHELKAKPEKAPGDWHDPKPIFFLTVPANIKFQFAIALRDIENMMLLDKVKKILVSTLKEFGVGAKTSLGYGRFY